MSPLSNSFLNQQQLNSAETFFPLCAYVCNNCLLVQLQEYETPDAIFSDYVYFSSFSESWLKHASDYADQMRARFVLGPESRVIEIASNDGYLLQFFKRMGIPVLGIEPAANVAAAAERLGISTLVRFFGTELAHELAATQRHADLLICNNVLAHVPDINNFVSGLKIALARDGLITLEFPHLLRLMAENQFDTIYHEHFSYLSLHAVERVFSSHGLVIFDVEELPTHGGSLRVFASHAGHAAHPVTPRVGLLREKETAAGLLEPHTYTQFSQGVQKVKRDLLGFLIRAREEGKSVVAYGAPAKGNTLLNYCGIRTDLIDYTVDRSPHKQGLFLPGTHIPVLHPDAIQASRPDFLLILPWNLKQEIMEQMTGIRSWGGKFVIPIPQLQIIP
jgi:SAM-dependent methyltransferase